MQLSRTPFRLLLAGPIGLAFSALAAHAQLVAVKLNETATFGSFAGGSPDGVTFNSFTNFVETITTGTSSGSPFSITFTPLFGPANVNLNIGTLTTSRFTFTSPINPANYFTTVPVILSYDFDHNGIVDLTQDYALNLAPYTVPNGLTGAAYSRSFPSSSSAQSRSMARPMAMPRWWPTAPPSCLTVHPRSRPFSSSSSRLRCRSHRPTRSPVCWPPGASWSCVAAVTPPAWLPDRLPSGPIPTNI